MLILMVMIWCSRWRFGKVAFHNLLEEVDSSSFPFEAIWKPNILLKAASLVGLLSRERFLLIIVIIFFFKEGTSCLVRRSSLCQEDERMRSLVWYYTLGFFLFGITVGHCLGFLGCNLEAWKTFWWFGKEDKKELYCYRFKADCEGKESEKFLGQSFT